MNKRWPLILSFVLFILLCVSAAYWGMQLFQPPPRPVAAPPQPASPQINPQAAARLFGGGGTSVETASNFELRGVIFAGDPRDSVAILSADGEPAKAVRAGGQVAEGVTVKEVHRRYVLLDDGGAVKRVDLPEDDKRSGSAITAPVPTRPVSPPRSPSLGRPPPSVPGATQQALPPEQQLQQQQSQQQEQQQQEPQQPQQQEVLPQPAPPPADQSSGPEPDQAVPDAAAAARAQLGLGAPPPPGSDPAEYAPQAPGTVVVNPDGSMTTGNQAPPGQ